jgi:putative transposase
MYLWKKKFHGMDVADAKKLKGLESENSRLKRMLADAMITIDDLKFLQTKNF